MKKHQPLWLKELFIVVLTKRQQVDTTSQHPYYLVRPSLTGTLTCAYIRNVKEANAFPKKLSC
jgi:hypothetical protein